MWWLLPELYFEFLSRQYWGIVVLLAVPHRYNDSCCCFCKMSNFKATALSLDSIPRDAILRYPEIQVPAGRYYCITNGSSKADINVWRLIQLVLIKTACRLQDVRCDYNDSGSISAAVSTGKTCSLGLCGVHPSLCIHLDTSFATTSSSHREARPPSGRQPIMWTTVSSW